MRNQRTIPFWSQLRWNLTIVFILLAILPLVITMSLILFRLQQQEQEHLTQHLEQMTISGQEQIEAEALTALARNFSLVVALLSALVAALIGYYSANRIAGPITELTRVAHALGQGDFSQRARVHTGNEVETLAQALNQMADNIQQYQAERKQIEEALRESEARYRAVVDTQQELICRFLPDTTLTFVNEAYCRYWGKRREELIGQSFLNLIPDNARQLVKEQIESLLINPRLEMDDYPYIFPNGEIKWQQWSDYAIFDQAGRIVEFQSVGRDVTERKQAEAALKAYSERLEEMVAARTKALEEAQERLVRQEKLAAIGQMSGSIAHELRNPLGAIKQSVFYLQRLYLRGQLETTNPKVKEHLDLIREEIDTSDRVISDLLEMTRTRPPQPERVELRPIILSAAERSNLTPTAQLQLDLQPDPFFIWADQGQIQQVLVNVMTNAGQACPENGLVSVTARCLPDEVMIQIKDNGNGIEASLIEKVFEPLYTTKAKGTGLGLSICKQIIENHSGQITLSSQINEGTTVEIRLPHCPAEATIPTY